MSKKACRCSIRSTLALFLRLLWNFLNKPLRRELQEEKSSKLGAAATCINVSFDLQNYLGKCANNGTNNGHQWELYYLLPLPHPNHHPLSPLQFLQNLPPTPLDPIHCWPHFSIFREVLKYLYYIIFNMIPSYWDWIGNGVLIIEWW